MRGKSLVLFVIAIGCGLAASIGVSQYMENANGLGGQTETAKILVAMTDINIAEKINAQTVKLEEWPKDRVPEGALHELSEVEGKFSRMRMYAGEPILQAKLMDSKDSVSTTIPKGYRVVAIKASVDNASAGLMQPGDRVDVVVLLRKSAEVPETGARTILKDVNVFSVDGETERGVDENGRTRTLSTVSLLLKPRQAEAAMLASELGRLFLTLRRPDDDVEVVDDDGETVRSLLGSSGESANDRRDRTEDGVPEWLLGNPVVQPPAPVVEVEVAAPVDVAPKWKMVILGTSGTREFLWSDENELPIEAGTHGNGNPRDSASPPTPKPPAPRTPPTSPPPDSTVDDLAPVNDTDTEEDIPISPH